MKNSLNAYHAKRVGVRICVSIVRFVFVSCVCYLFLFPLLYLLIASIQTPEHERPSVVWIPRELTAQNFARAAEMLDFGRSFALTAAIAVFGTLATLFSCAMAGYALARFEFLEKRLAFALVLILIIIPPQTTSMSVFLNFRFFDPLGIISAFGTADGYRQLESDRLSGVYHPASGFCQRYPFRFIDLYFPSILSWPAKGA